MFGIKIYHYKTKKTYKFIVIINVNKNLIAAATKSTMFFLIRLKLTIFHSFKLKILMFDFKEIIIKSYRNVLY